MKNAALNYLKRNDWENSVVLNEIIEVVPNLGSLSAEIVFYFTMHEETSFSG